MNFGRQYRGSTRVLTASWERKGEQRDRGERERGETRRPFSGLASDASNASHPRASWRCQKNYSCIGRRRLRRHRRRRHQRRRLRRRRRRQAASAATATLATPFHAWASRIAPAGRSNRRLAVFLSSPSLPLFPSRGFVCLLPGERSGRRLVVVVVRSTTATTWLCQPTVAVAVRARPPTLHTRFRSPVSARPRPVFSVPRYIRVGCIRDKILPKTIAPNAFARSSHDRWDRRIAINEASKLPYRVAHAGV